MSSSFEASLSLLINCSSPYYSSHRQFQFCFLKSNFYRTRNFFNKNKREREVDRGNSAPYTLKMLKNKINNLEY